MLCKPAHNPYGSWFSRAQVGASPQGLYSSLPFESSLSCTHHSQDGSPARPQNPRHSWTPVSSTPQPDTLNRTKRRQRSHTSLGLSAGAVEAPWKKQLECHLSPPPTPEPSLSPWPPASSSAVRNRKDLPESGIEKRLASRWSVHKNAKLHNALSSSKLAADVSVDSEREPGLFLRVHTLRGDHLCNLSPLRAQGGETASRLISPQGSGTQCRVGPHVSEVSTEHIVVFGGRERLRGPGLGGGPSFAEVRAAGGVTRVQPLLRPRPVRASAWLSVG